MIWIIFLIFLAIFFDYLNGFHDAANSVATIVSTRVLSPKFAVIWAAFFNFVALFVFHTGVAKTIGSGIVDISIVDTNLVFGALMSACIWNLLTWWWGLPSSSSHALIGGLIGAALIKAGPGALVSSGIIKTVVFIVIAPIMGVFFSVFIASVVFRLFQRANPFKVDHLFRKGQLLSAAAYSLGHGGNDAQKTMGIITMLLFGGLSGASEGASVVRDFFLTTSESARLAGGDSFFIPVSIIVLCQAAIALGTLSGGWRIVKTMGQKVTRLKPVDGFCAETGAALSLFISSWLGIPVSTTHTITGGIVGIGSFRRFSAVRWGVARKIVWAWVITIPACIAIAAFSYMLAVAILG
ncbi:MAG: inorganic phosphate transporter [Elusimicrobiota bacterium]|jgi:PiT family inorganic phosphate transporter|nr:inorganic phosphate transporter [Elusimicrobiota bacterium]